MTQDIEHNLINLTIDGTPISVPKGTTVYKAIKQLNIDVPIFCYQDRMPPFGACRVCMVEVEKMGKPQTSCTLEATEGMVVKTQSQMAVQSRKEILEFLLINHPLDCPICDRGGECPLQDQTMKFGPGESRFYEEKRRLEKAKSLGPVLKLDQERCISCARCTRFGDIVAGDQALQFIDRGYKTEIGTHDDQAAKSKYIGNTIMICPVGALTSNVYRFRARPWDNHHVQTTCTLCPVGCSMTIDSRDGEIMRTRSSECHDVNDIWLCDKGWFGYEFTSSRNRLKTPLMRNAKGNLVAVSWQTALSCVATKMKEAVTGAAFSGNCLTTEEYYLLQKLMTDGLKTPHVDHRIGIRDESAYGMDISLSDCETLSYAFVFGSDVTEEFPLIWLRLKQAINKGARVQFFGHYTPEIARYCEKVVLHPPGSEIQVLQEYEKEIQEIIGSPKKGAIFVGRQYLSSQNRNSILSLLSSWSNEALSLNILEGRQNSYGARFSGMHPEFEAFGKKRTNPGLSVFEVLQTASQKPWDLLYIVGSNAIKKFPKNIWDRARKNIGCLIVQDLFLTETAFEADIVLPTLSFLEKEGHFINIEGRIRKIHPGKEIPSHLMSDGEIFMKLAEKLSYDLKIDSYFKDALESSHIPKSPLALYSIPTPSFVESNGLTVSFEFKLFDQGVRMKHNEHLFEFAQTAPSARIHPNELIKMGIQDGSVARFKTEHGSIVQFPITSDNSVSEKCVVVPVGFDEIPAHEIDVNLMNGVKIIYDV